MRHAAHELAVIVGALGARRIRSERHPFGRLFETPVSQPSMTSVGEQVGSSETLSKMENVSFGLSKLRKVIVVFDDVTQIACE